MNKTRTMQCIGGPHDGEWHEIDWICDKIILCKPKVGEIRPMLFPTLENIKREFNSMIEKTTYVIDGDHLVPE